MSKKIKKPKEEDFDDDDCEVCRLIRGNPNPTEEALLKAFSLQNFLNNFPKDQDKKK